VTIQQAQPEVTVKQGQPEIIVRQGAPTITVDIPQPEIIVRMPQPEVKVAQAQPQVQVTQPPPQVQVIQPQQQAQVQVDKAQPQVTLTQGQQPANVQIQQAGQPIVRYERADAQVKVNQAEGQPTVRVEQMTAAIGTNTTKTADPVVGQQAALTTPKDTANPISTRQVAVLDLRGVDIVNERGDKLGDVDHLVTNVADNQTYVIMAHGGFLGLGEKKVALPLSSMWMDGKKLAVSGLTDDQIKRMPEWKPQPTAYRDMTAGQTSVRITR